MKTNPPSLFLRLQRDLPPELRVAAQRAPPLVQGEAGIIGGDGPWVVRCDQRRGGWASPPPRRDPSLADVAAARVALRRAQVAEDLERNFSVQKGEGPRGDQRCARSFNHLLRHLFGELPAPGEGPHIVGELICDTHSERI